MVSKIGDPILRKEDLRLLRGKGVYTDDNNLDGQAYVHILRTPHAHAEIANIDTAAARAAPGVLTVLTGADANADGLSSIHHTPASGSPPDIPLENRDGSDKYISPHPVLSADRVRFVGEAVAVVIAETVGQAKDAAELISVDYTPLPSVTHTADTLAATAPTLWEDFGSNTSVDASAGDAAATDAAFASADHVVRFETWINRVTGTPMEPRSAIGDYDAAADHYTVYMGGGGVVRPRNECAGVLGVEPEQVRFIAGDVGGNFGTRNGFYPEFALVAWAAKRVGRPVKWTSDRSETMLSDHQGRDLLVTAELALDKEGKFLGLRADNVSNVGAYTISFVPLTKGMGLLSGNYIMPTGYVRGRAVHSNTPSTNPYRSAGRPEVIYVIERLIDLAAREHGFDRVDLRRRNLIPADVMPYTNPFGMTYDSGAYEMVMDWVLDMSDWDGFAARKEESRKRGKHRGIGLANYLESSAGAPRERAEITVHPEGTIDFVIGTLSSGQGHETSFPQLITEFLGVEHDDVNYIQGDTKYVSVGGGSHSGRSMRFAGIVVANATDEIIKKGKEIASHVLEAAVADIEFSDAQFSVTGTDRRVGLYDVARAAMEQTNLPEELRGELGGVGDVVIRQCAFPFGSHVCEVEVDTETGDFDIVRYAGVDDVGRAVNPLILHGQAHGGIVQGLGQAWFENCHFDAESGQVLSGSFMDYALPRADKLPSFSTAISEVPGTTNPLGIRAGGEGGTTPALGVLINALVDALSEFGVKHIEMPATPERVWRAIHGE
jgi:carbon-monoxide dehydrogenase large subunit